MPLNQMNDQLNDAFETYFPKFGVLIGFVYRLFSLLVLIGLKLRIKIFGGKLLVNERIVEYTQICQWIRSKGKVLDVGCVSSRLPIQLAGLGYEVHGVDTRNYPFKHPNFYFYKVDIFKWSPTMTFDIIILVSALEHFGLGGYGDLVLPEADRRAVAQVSKWLRRGGQLLVTVPFGKPEVTKKHRIYDIGRLKYLFSDFKWVQQRFFERVEGAWVQSSAEKLKNVVSSTLPPNGVAILDLERK